MKTGIIVDFIFISALLTEAIITYVLKNVANKTQEKQL